MPWCTACDQFLSPSTVRADGTCPKCGRPVDAGRARLPSPAGGSAAGGSPEVASPEVASPDVASPDVASPGRSANEAPDAPPDDELPPIPWHLWLMLAALTVYLGYRAFQGVEWLFGI